MAPFTIAERPALATNQPSDRNKLSALQWTNIWPLCGISQADPLPAVLTNSAVPTTL
jgi:hypothetical protein